MSKVDGVIRIVGSILDIIDLMAEALESDNVMNVLPDDSRDGHPPMNPRTDDFFRFMIDLDEFP